MIPTNNDITLFGIKILEKSREKEAKETSDLHSFAPELNDDGSRVFHSNEFGPYGMPSGGFAGYSLDLHGVIKDEIGLIRQYRRMSNHSECDEAIDNILNEAIVQLDVQDTVSLDLDKLENKEKLKNTINEEFTRVKELLDFEDKAVDLFRRWYIDGRLYFHKIVDKTNPKKGILAIKRIDPLTMTKVKNVIKSRSKESPMASIVKRVDEYFIYNEGGLEGQVSPQGVKIAPESITYVPSGLMDETGKMTLGHMHKAIRPLNQLRMIEDAAIIYRVTRAPERRVFYVDVGNMPPQRAEQYLRDTMNRYKNRVTYDASSGKIHSDRRHMHMMEDFWLPRMSNGKTTEITTLPGGQGLGDIQEIIYFQKNFYKALNVPASRLESDVGLMNRGVEISRDELNFKKYIKRLQKQFSLLFIDILGTQLELKGFVNRAEWKEIKQKIRVVFAEDSYFTESFEQELDRNRLEILDQMVPYLGQFYSKKYIQKNILKMSDEDIERIEKEMEEEIKSGTIEDPDTPEEEEQQGFE